MHDLQGLTVDPSAEKEKQKADWKHILQQKQRALSDLFKMLTEIGECRFYLVLVSHSGSREIHFLFSFFVPGFRAVVPERSGLEQNF